MTEARARNGRPDVEALREEIRQTRVELGQTVEALAAKADIKARMKESAEHTAERMKESAGQAVEKVKGRLVEAGEAAKRRPVPLAAIAGGAVALLVIYLVIRGRRR
jgi:hypothetical protein